MDICWTGKFKGIPDTGAMTDDNFYLESGLAYTDDRIPVYNVFVYKISRLVKEEDVKSYFEQFGQINKIRFQIKKTFGRDRVSINAFIDFKDARAAARVLNQTTHKIGTSKAVSVKACDSWHQPGGNFVGVNNEACSKARTKIKANNKHKKPTIQDLNDDCLLLIMKQMSLRDQILFACSHERFKTVFQIYAKTEYKTFKTSLLENLSLWNIRQFFIFAGHCIEIFTGMIFHDDRESIFIFIGRHCSNLIQIKLEHTKVKLRSLHKMLNKKPKLTTLSLNSCGVNDHCIYAIKKLINLENLIITRSCDFSGRNLNSLKKLKMLRLLRCYNLKPSHLQKALPAMPNLRLLDIRAAQHLSHTFFAILPNLTKNLETIQISCYNPGYENVAKIPKLKNFCIMSTVKEIRNELFHQLAKEKCNQLESLEISALSLIDFEICQSISKLNSLKRLNINYNDGITDKCLSVLSELSKLEELQLNNCKNITNKGVLKIVSRCTKLKYVNIQGTNIDNNFVRSIIAHLKRNKRLSGRLIFFVASTKISEIELQQDYKNADVQKMIKFNFIRIKSSQMCDNFDDVFENQDCEIVRPHILASINEEFFGHDMFDVHNEDDYDLRLLHLRFAAINDDRNYELEDLEDYDGLGFW